MFTVNIISPIEGPISTSFANIGDAIIYTYEHRAERPSTNNARTKELLSRGMRVMSALMDEERYCFDHPADTEKGQKHYDHLWKYSCLWHIHVDELETFVQRTVGREIIDAMLNR